MARPSRVAPRDRAAWRAWLAEHHVTVREIFVVFHRKGTGASVSYDEAVEEALCFGWIDGVKQKLDDTRYTHRFTPRTPASKWSASNRRRAAAMIAAGKMQPAGHAAIDAALRAGTWDLPAASSAPSSSSAPAASSSSAAASAAPAASAASAASSAPPVELASALAHSTAAKRAFDALAPGQRRLWMRWVGEAKQAATRTRRAARTVEQLRAGHKVPHGA